METSGQRLSQYIENKGFTKKEFCEMADLAYNNFVRVLNGTRPMGINVLDKVKKVLGNLNVNWVLYNEGDPEIHSNGVDEPSEAYDINLKFENLIKKIVRDEVNPRFESVNKSVYILMKRDVAELNTTDKEKKKSS